MVDMVDLAVGFLGDLEPLREISRFWESTSKYRELEPEYLPLMGYFCTPP
jgi:hypothetical protein